MIECHTWGGLDCLLSPALAWSRCGILLIRAAVGSCLSSFQYVYKAPSPYPAEPMRSMWETTVQQRLCVCAHLIFCLALLPTSVHSSTISTSRHARPRSATGAGRSLLAQFPPPQPTPPGMSSASHPSTAFQKGHRVQRAHPEPGAMAAVHAGFQRQPSSSSYPGPAPGGFAAPPGATVPPTASGFPGIPRPPGPTPGA